MRAGPRSGRRVPTGRTGPEGVFGMQRRPERRNRPTLTMSESETSEFFPYPPELRHQIYRLHIEARQRYEYNANDRGKGEGWRTGEPRYHYWKAVDELFTATHLTKQGAPEAEILKACADGLNHVTMALELYDEEQPPGLHGGPAVRPHEPPHGPIAEWADRQLDAEDPNAVADEVAEAIGRHARERGDLPKRTGRTCPDCERAFTESTFEYDYCPGCGVELP